jgi:Protein of unknown function (DUF3558)
VSAMSLRVATVAAAVLVALAACTSCTRTVTGSAQRAVGSDDHGAKGYGFALDRCGLLLDNTVAQVVGADKVVRPYSGAVCQYVMSRAGTVVDATFSWFESGTLDRERNLAQQNHAQMHDVVVQRHQGFLARRSVTGNACSATAATNPGVASWWVQIRGDVSADPCKDAQNLLAKTLTANM